MRLQPLLAATLLAGLSLVYSAYRLGTPSPTADEVTLNMHAQTVLNGKPSVFFHTSGDKWLQPLPVYLNAAVRAAGAGSTSGRIASAIEGAINVALVFAIALLITERLWIAVIGSLILIFTPAHYALSIIGTDAILPATLILAWLLGALQFFKHDAVRSVIGSAVALGLAVYAHPSGPLTAPLLWILLLAVAFRRNRMRLFVATAVFGLMWVPAAAYFVRHPEAYPDTFGRWFVFSAHLRNPIDGLLAFVNPNTLGNRASLYWSFWDPSWLFFRGPRAGSPLLLIAAPFIALAVLRWPTHGIRDAAVLVIGSTLIVPLAGATFGAPHYIDNAAAVLPLLAVLTAVGVDELVRLIVPRRPLEDDVAAPTIE